MPERDVLYHEVLEALQAEGCAICRLAWRVSDSYTNALLHEGVVDVDLRQKLRDARGLCYHHAWRMTHKRSSVLGTAIVYRDVINTLTKGLEAPDKRTLFGAGETAAQRLAATGPCPACRLETAAIERSVKTLLKHIQDAQIATSYIAAGGLCLPHFTETLAHANGTARRSLAEWQATVYRRLRDELDELIRTEAGRRVSCHLYPQYSRLPDIETAARRMLAASSRKKKTKETQPWLNLLK